MRVVEPASSALAMMMLRFVKGNCVVILVVAWAIVTLSHGTEASKSSYDFNNPHQLKHAWTVILCNKHTTSWLVSMIVLYTCVIARRTPQRRFGPPAVIVRDSSRFRRSLRSVVNQTHSGNRGAVYVVLFNADLEGANLDDEERQHYKSVMNATFLDRNTTTSTTVTASNSTMAAPAVDWRTRPFTRVCYFAR